MQKYKSNIMTTAGAAIRDVPVTVLKEDGSLASIFMDREGHVPAPNPLKSEQDGTFYFYAENGRYSLNTTVEGATITDTDVVLLFDPAEGQIADAVAMAEAAVTQVGEVVAKADQATEDVAALRVGVQAVEQATQGFDGRLTWVEGRLSPIQQTDASALNENEAWLGGGVQASVDNEKLMVEPPIGIVSAYSVRTIVEPRVDWPHGWTSGLSQAIITRGIKNINKVVGAYTQIDPLNQSTNAILGFEASIASPEPGSVHQASADFFSPNLEFVPNRNRIIRQSAFANQDKGKVIQSYGPYIDEKFRELAPADHPGYVAGRWYSNPFFYVENYAFPSANSAILAGVHIKARVHLETLRFFTGTTVASGAKFRLGIYTAVQGKIMEKVWTSPVLSGLTANADVDGSVDIQIDPGFYWFVFATDLAGSSFKLQRQFANVSVAPALYGVTDTSIKEASLNCLLYTPLPSLASLDMQVLDAMPTYAYAAPNSHSAPAPHFFFKPKAISLPSYAGNGRPA